MVNTDAMLLTGLNRYFTHLAQFGESGEQKQFSLLLLSFIQQLIVGPMNVFITLEDEGIIEQAIFSLQGSNCFLDYSIMGLSTSMFDNHRANTDPLQILEDSVTLNLGEDSTLRFQVV